MENLKNLDTQDSKANKSLLDKVHAVVIIKILMLKKWDNMKQLRKITINGSDFEL